jgi:hypothetical protein
MKLIELPFYMCLTEPYVDEDKDEIIYGTKTFTETSTEDTDEDPSSYQISLGTETFTKTQSESSDNDPSLINDIYNN